MVSTNSVNEELALQDQLLNGDENVVLIPFHREDVKRMKCLKFAADELPRLEKFTQYLASTVNPVTGQVYIAQPQFSAMVHFSLNLAFRYMAVMAEEEAKQEVAS